MTRTFNVDGTWALFLDRDGTINKRLHGRYVTDWDQFEFLEGAMEGISDLNPIFGTIALVTNQQGIGKGLMTHERLHDIHEQMMERIAANGGRIDEIYYCPHLAEDDPMCRKPNPGMAIQAATDFPDIIFTKSMMVGDTETDMEFGRRLGMVTVLILDGSNSSVMADLQISSLSELSLYLNVD